MPMIIDGEEYFGIREACVYLGGISRETLRRRAEAFGIQKYGRGVTKHVYYKKTDIDKLNQLRPIGDGQRGGQEEA